jgi:hypothetical protein
MSHKLKCQSLTSFSENGDAWEAFYIFDPPASVSANPNKRRAEMFDFPQYESDSL